MGLQVRVTHALGSRLIELPDRTIDNPITVGRSSRAEVQVPSVSVAARHCVLFRYDGHWAVQDVQAAAGSGTSGTFVNGQQVTDPVILQIGDVITIGSEASAPRIEVDPAAAAEGRTGWAGGEQTPLPVVPGYAAPARFGAPPPAYAASGGYVSTSAYTAAPGYRAGNPVARAAPSTAAQSGWDAGSVDNGDHVDMGPSLESATYRPSYRRRKQQGTPFAAIVVGALVCSGIVGFTVWWAMSHSQQSVVVVAPPAKPKPADDGNRSNNIFGIGARSTTGSSVETTSTNVPVASQPVTTDGADVTGNSGAPRAAPANPTSTAVTPSGISPGSGSEEMTPATPVAGTPGKSAPDKAGPPAPTDEWQEIQDLHNAQTDAAVAIFRFNDFQKRHAGQHADDLAKYLDDKFDRLWWERIEQLFKKSDRIKADIVKKQNDIFDETDKDMKKKEQEEVAKLKADEKLTKEMLLTRMGYKEDQPPPASGAELAMVRAKRDNGKYTDWKRTTLNSIINNKGKTDWVADN